MAVGDRTRGGALELASCDVARLTVEPRTLRFRVVASVPVAAVGGDRCLSRAVALSALPMDCGGVPRDPASAVAWAEVKAAARGGSRASVPLVGEATGFGVCIARHGDAVVIVPPDRSALLVRARQGARAVRRDAGARGRFSGLGLAPGALVAFRSIARDADGAFCEVDAAVTLYRRAVRPEALSSVGGAVPVRCVRSADWLRLPGGVPVLELVYDPAEADDQAWHEALDREALDWGAQHMAAVYAAEPRRGRGGSGRVERERSDDAARAKRRAAARKARKQRKAKASAGKARRSS